MEGARRSTGDTESYTPKVGSNAQKPSTAGESSINKTARATLEALKFNVVNTPDHSTEGFSLKTLLHKFSFVTITENGQKYDLNIRSAAKRLGITPMEVRALAKKESAATELQENASARSQTIEKYNQIVSQFTKNRLGLRQVGTKMLRSETILKAIHQGLNIQGNGDKFKIGFRQFYATSLKNQGKVDVVINLMEKKLGEGSFGKVFKVFTLNTGKYEALKESKPEKGEYAATDNDAKNEKTILDHLNPNGDVKGIQKPPTEVTTITGEQGKIGFYRTELMTTDLYNKGKFMPKFQKMTAENRLKLCGQVISGLAHMEEKGVKHGDIKPENLLMKEDAEGNPAEFVIADWGGAEMDGKNPTVSTPIYKPSDGVKHDVFSLSLTLIEALAGRRMDLPLVWSGSTGNKGLRARAVKKDSDLYNKIFEELKKNGIPENVARVLLSGICEAKDRPDATQLEHYFRQAVNAMSQDEKNAVRK